LFGLIAVADLVLRRFIDTGDTGWTVAVLLAGCGQPSAPTDANVAQADANGAEAALPPFAEVENAHPTAPEPAPIPAKFRGTWAESKTACTNLNHPSRLTISGRTVRTPTAVLVGESFTFPAANQFALDGKFEGGGRAGAAH
jgi:hypothetical protein